MEDGSFDVIVACESILCINSLNTPGFKDCSAAVKSAGRLFASARGGRLWAVLSKYQRPITLSEPGTVAETVLEIGMRP
jgi:hypothetical protein